MLVACAVLLDFLLSQPTMPPNMVSATPQLLRKSDAVIRSCKVAQSQLFCPEYNNT